jgi:hypothetical protein
MRSLHYLNGERLLHFQLNRNMDNELIPSSVLAIRTAPASDPLGDGEWEVVLVNFDTGSVQPLQFAKTAISGGPGVPVVAAARTSPHPWTHRRCRRRLQVIIWSESHRVGIGVNPGVN